MNILLEYFPPRAGAKTAGDMPTLRAVARAIPHGPALALSEAEALESAVPAELYSWGGGTTPRATDAHAKRASKRPIVSREDLDALVAAARALSAEHWEVVIILSRTGIEVEGLRRITWRDLADDELHWNRGKQGELVVFPLEDPELRLAVRGFVQRPKRSTDRLDRLVRQARDAAGRPGLAGVSSISLRLTRCLHLLEEGMNPEAVARLLALKPAVVRDVARHAIARAGHED